MTELAQAYITAAPHKKVKQITAALQEKSIEVFIFKSDNVTYVLVKAHAQSQAVGIIQDLLGSADIIKKIKAAI